MVKTLKSKHKKDLSKKRSFRQSAGMEEVPTGDPNHLGVEAPQPSPEVPSEPQGQLDYDDYPRSEQIEQALPNQAVYTPLMYLSPMLTAFSEMKTFIQPNDGGNKFKLTSLQKFAEYVSSVKTNNILLPYIVKKMDITQFQAFLFYYLVVKSDPKLEPSINQSSDCIEDNNNNKINLYCLLREIMDAMCLVASSYNFSGKRFYTVFGKSDKTIIEQLDKRLVQLFSLYFHDFCIVGDKSSYDYMNSFMSDNIKKESKIVLTSEKFPILKKLFPNRFSEDKPLNDTEIETNIEDLKQCQQILFYLCFSLITSKIYPRGGFNKPTLLQGSYNIIQDMNKKITVPNIKIVSQSFEKATKRETLENIIPGGDSPNLFDGLDVIKFEEEMPNLHDNFSSQCLPYMSISQEKKINCLPKPSGGKRSRKATSKTRKPKTLKRPLRANHRIKKAASVESRRRVSKNRNTSHRRA